MGCDIHAVLQEFNPQHNLWVTILKDVFPNRDYPLFTFLSGVRGNPGPHDEIAISGLPADFQVDAKGEHDGFQMGEHSFGHITLDDFLYKVKERNTNPDGTLIEPSIMSRFDNPICKKCH